MILKNWYKALATLMSTTEVKVVNVVGDEVKAGNTGGTSPNAGHAMNLNYTSSSASANLCYLRAGYDKSGGIVIGNGNEPVSFEDYKLSGDVLTTISAPTATPTITIDENGFTAKVTHTVTNTGSDAITVSEIGLMAKNAHVASISAGYLIERTVLDSPITIPAGGVGQVTYTFRFNYPTA